MSNGMQWKPISEFNPNNYKEDDTFNIFTKDGYYDLVTLEITNGSYSSYNLSSFYLNNKESVPTH